MYSKDIKPGEQVIGMSLSLCVAEIVAGRVGYEQVTKIVAGTRAGDDAAWETMLRDDYCKYRWDHLGPDGVEEAVRIANCLRAEGKIDQPRLQSPRAPNLYAGEAGGVWVRTASEIVYFDTSEIDAA